MTKMNQRQLELPVLVDLNGRSSVRSSDRRSSETLRQHEMVDVGFHKPASDDDQSIYKAMCDNYFGAAAKQA